MKRKIVIELEEEDYERLKEYKKAPFYSLPSRLYEAVANGELLPKGHGNLVDISTINFYEDEFYNGEDYERAISVIDNAVPIIGADKDVEVEECQMNRL